MSAVHAPQRDLAVRREEEGVPSHMRGWVSGTLRVGAAIALVILTAGLILLALRDGSAPFAGSGHADDVLQGLLAGQASAALLLGLLVLIVTPLVRVVVSASLFSAAGDRRFVGLTLFVLACLLASVAIGVLL